MRQNHIGLEVREQIPEIDEIADETLVEWVTQEKGATGQVKASNPSIRFKVAFKRSRVKRSAQVF